jgi:hypothetical protein
LEQYPREKQMLEKDKAGTTYPRSRQMKMQIPVQQKQTRKLKCQGSAITDTIFFRRNIGPFNNYIMLGM